MNVLTTDPQGIEIPKSYLTFRRVWGTFFVLLMLLITAVAGYWFFVMGGSDYVLKFIDAAFTISHDIQDALHFS